MLLKSISLSVPRKRKNGRRKGLHLQQLSTVGKKGKTLSNMLTADLLFKAKVVNLILSKDTEEALELLSQRYQNILVKVKVK